MVWRGSLGLLGILLALSACGVWEPPPAPGVTPTLVTLSQWAATAEASSEYAVPDWSARRATGAAEVASCRDDPRAWASARGNGIEWLEVTFPTPVHAVEVRVYQSFGRGAVSRVTLLAADGSSEVIWEGTDAFEPCPGVLVAPVPRTPYRVVGVRVDLDESRTGYWNQIDAVQLIGVR